MNQGQPVGSVSLSLKRHKVKTILDPMALFYIFVLFALFILGPIVGLVWGVVRFRKSATGIRKVLWGTGVCSASIYLGYLYWLVSPALPWHSGIVVQGTSPKGAEYCVVQSYYNVVEGYRVSFYIRDTGGVWHQSIMDFETSAWRSAKVDFSDALAAVSRDGVLYREIPLPAKPVDWAAIKPDERNNHCPSNFTVAEVVQSHHRP